MIHLHKLEAFRHFIARDRQLIEAVPDRHGTAHWTESSAACPWQDIDGVPLSSLKPYFFAERETVFVFDGQQFRSRLPEPPARVFFGVKSCDAAALAIQDRFFAEDEYYQARRRQALVVAIDCSRPCKGGFCPLTNAGPLVREGADLVLTPLENNGWLLDAISADGKSLLHAFSAAMDAENNTAGLVDTDPAKSSHWHSVREDIGAACVSAFGDLDILARGLARVQAGQVDEACWETLAIQCLSCSGCVNLCPSCSCFTTSDHSNAEGIVRERVWDACLYEGFQREASGHHPSATPGARTARYWFHKFSPAFVVQQGRLGCTGCGRCDAVCPGVIGAKAVLKRIAAC